MIYKIYFSLEFSCWTLTKILWLCHVSCHFASHGSAGKESACSVGDLGSIPGLGRFPGEGKGYPLQYSSLENSMDCIILGAAKSRTRLSDFHSFIYACQFANEETET